MTNEYFLFIYVIIPFARIKNGVKHLINGKDDEDQHRIGEKELEIPPKGLSFLKLFDFRSNFRFIRTLGSFVTIHINFSVRKDPSKV